MSDESRRILDLLAQGKITVHEAHQLLHAIGRRRGNRPPPRRAGAQAAVAGDLRRGRRPRPAGEAPGVRYLKIEVNKAGAEGRARSG